MINNQRPEVKESLLREIIGLSSVGMAALQPITYRSGDVIDFRWLIINKKAEDIIGSRFIEGKSLLEVIPEQQSSLFFINLLKIANQGKALNFEYYFQRTKIWVEVSSHLYEDGILINLCDITKNKLFEEVLKKGVEQYKLLAENSTDVIAKHGIDGTYLYISPSVKIFAGYSPEDLLGKNVFSFLHPDDIEKVRFLQEELMTNPQILNLEFRFLCKDGTYKWIGTAVKRMFNETNQTLEVIASSREITERKKVEEDLYKAKEELEHKVEERTKALFENEERYRLAILSADIGTWDYNPFADDLKFDDKCKEIFSLSTDEKITFTKFLRTLHPDDVNNVDNVINYTLSPKSPGSFNCEFRIRGFEDKKEKWVAARGKVYKNDSGNPTRFIGTVLDITEKKEVEKFIQGSNDQLKRINVDLDNFIYTASHDLKSPISNIEGLLNVLNDTLPNDCKETENIIPLFNMFNEAISRLKCTIQDLTEITKVQKNQEDDVKVINICKLIEDIKVDLRQELATSKAIINTTNIICTEVKFSKVNLKSILYNLLGNAIKYRSPERQLEIEVSSAKVPGFTIITIKDNGLGIKKENHNKIFTMFKRFHNHVEGTGIGLYIVKRILDNTGGKIEVESEEGEGTMIKVFLKEIK